MKKILICLTSSILVLGLFTGCKDKSAAAKPVKGTIEEAFGADSIPQFVKDSFNKTSGTNDGFEVILDDKENNVSVLGLMTCTDGQSAQGYGVKVMKGNQETMLEIRHGNEPKAYYDASNGNLWFTGAVMEGTGTLVERPYLIYFDENGKANIVTSIDPYDMQQELCKRLSYSIEGQDITILVDGKPLYTVTNHVEDMGDFFDDAIWIGEQIEYVVDKDLTVNVMPGINFVTGKVLNYDDMLPITAKVNLNPDGTFTLSDFNYIK